MEIANRKIETKNASDYLTPKERAEAIWQADTPGNNILCLEPNCTAIHYSKANCTFPVKFHLSDLSLNYVDFNKT